MSLGHGVASFFMPGLGQMVGGEGKKGAKYLGTGIACGIVGRAAGLGLVQLSLKDDLLLNASKAEVIKNKINSITSSKPKINAALNKAINAVKIKAHTSKVLQKAVDIIKNPNTKKVAGVALAAVVVGAFVTAMANWIKSIADASKINKD